ncbi:hypothetical protein C1H46_040594 [Malus baccata]|uniref:Uncharacterized protein n=1 Tax=Malus baccata TaxID=106549 RepID=A0A540KIP8_MALBA|nr:hypothetical protein C1H46_040594 [Malus baccata]
MNSPKINKPPSASNTPPPPDLNTLPPPPSLQADHDQNCLLALRSARAFNNQIEYGTRNVNGVSVSGIVLNPLNSPISLDHGAVGVLPLYFDDPSGREAMVHGGVSLAPPTGTIPLAQL